MRTRIRIDNDFVFLWSIERGGKPEDLTTVLEKHLFLHKVNSNPNSDKEITSYEVINGNILRIELTPEMMCTTGNYDLIFKYVLPDTSLSDNDRKCAVDVEAFSIVSKTSKADRVYDVAATSDMMIGLKGDAFTYEDFTPEQLEALKVKGDTGNGIQSITLFSTVGKVKTYQIRFTDQTTTTFEVEDGADGHSPEITDLSKRKNLLIATKPIIVAGQGILNQLAPFYEVVNGILNNNTSIGETLFLSYKYILEGNTQETNLGTHYWRCKTNDDLGWTNIREASGKKVEISHEEVNVVKEINISFIVDDKIQVITEFGARLENIPTDLTFKMWDVFLYKKNTDWIPESEDKESIRHIHEISDIVGLDDALTRLENKSNWSYTFLKNI